MNSRRRLLLGAVAVLVMPAPALTAQAAEAPAGRRPEAYGTTSRTVQVVGSCAFQARFPSIEAAQAVRIGGRDAGSTWIATSRPSRGSFAR